MKFSTICFGVAAAITRVLAQSSTTPAVPHGTPVPGNYTGALRPQIHYSPPQGFMNDPNGCFRDDNGTWHLYYQYNPTATVAGNQHWGHATSPDLYHWTNQPIALFPVNESSYIFSGSSVIDRNNTSGFFPNQNNGVVAIFTIATYEPILLQTQGIAYSHDGGYTFEMYANNPVIDVGSSQFRDPKVFWYGDHWVMAVAYATDFVIGFFTSPDLKEWTHASNFTRHGLVGLQYECPNLVEVSIENSDDTTWLLQISINPGAPLGGSAAEYFLGAFDGYKFSPVDNSTRLTDFSKDAYAGQFFDNLPRGEAVSIHWASNWQYTQEVPTGELEGWRSAMAVPRTVTVRNVERFGMVEITRPYDLTPILGRQLAAQDVSNSSFAVDFSGVPSNAIYLNVTVSNLPPRANITTGTFNMTLMSPITGEYLRAGYYLNGDNPVWIDRGGVRGFDNVFFTDKFSTNSLAPPDGGSWTMEALWDRSLFETFIEDGHLSSTTSAYPLSPFSVLTFGASLLPTGVRVRVEVYEITSAWTPQEDASGTVRGNVTMSSTAGNSSVVLERSHPRMVYETSFD